MKRNIMKRRGLTLIEIIISLAIFSIISIPIITMILSSVKLSKSGENKQKATLMAQQIIETIKAVPSKDFGNLDRYGSELSLNITRKADKKDGFNISGALNGFSVSGYVEPSEEYKFDTTSSEAPEISYDVLMEFLVDSTNNSNTMLQISKKGEASYAVYLNTKDIEISNFIEEGQPTINIMGQRIILDNSKATVKIVFGEGVQGPYNINVNNKNGDALSLYIYKTLNSQIQYMVNNNEGIVKTYSNLISDNIIYNNSSRLYKIFLSVKKGSTSFEISTYRSVSE